MTDNEIRIAIAEACGWKWKPSPQCNHPNKLRWWIPPWFKNEGWEFGGPDVEIPNYPTDLNAMHEVEKILDRARNGQIAQYAGNLWRVMFDSPEAEIGTIHATARQRAEAFLRTIDKWKEDA